MCDTVCVFDVLQPEALGHLIEGLPFHEYYFKMPSSAAPGAPPAHVLNTMASPKVRVLGTRAHPSVHTPSGLGCICVRACVCVTV